MAANPTGSGSQNQASPDNTDADADCYHIYSQSDRHPNRILPAHLSYLNSLRASADQYVAQPEFPEIQDQGLARQRRLLHTGLQNSPLFILARTQAAVQDDLENEQARARDALATELATNRRREISRQAAVRAHILTEADHFSAQSPAQVSARIEFWVDVVAVADIIVGHWSGTPWVGPAYEGGSVISPQNGPILVWEEDNSAALRAKLSWIATLWVGPVVLPDIYNDQSAGIPSNPSDAQDYFANSVPEDEAGIIPDLLQEFRDHFVDSDDSEYYEGSADPFADFDGTFVDSDCDDEPTEESEQDHDQSSEQSENRDMDSVDEILAAHAATFSPDDEDEDEDMGDDIDLTYDDGEDVGEDEEHDIDSAPIAPFNPIAMGLKEIGGLAHFRVSSFKPGNGVDELKNDDTDRYWQSDGVQPHRLTMAFVKQVEIRALRFYVDYIQDESYTPTKIIWKAGTSENNLFKFAESELVNPSGWIDVPIMGAGGGEDGNSLMAWVVRMEVVENHQNGKDTHIRGLKIYGFDDQLRAAGPTGQFDREEGEKFKLDDSKNAEENEQALIAHLRTRDLERQLGAGDPSGTASSLDFIEDPIIR